MEVLTVKMAMQTALRKTLTVDFSHDDFVHKGIQEKL